MPETTSSTDLVTCASSSAGAAPNCVIVTETTGTSTFGSCVIGSLLKVRIPSAQSAADTTMGGSGCRIDHAEMLTAISVLPLDRTGQKTGCTSGRRATASGAMAVEPRVNGPLAHVIVVAIGDFIASGLDFNDPMSRSKQRSVVTPPNCAVQSAF